MSTNLSVKNVPDALADKLRARAERNHRSLQGELMAIIEHAVAEEAIALPGAPVTATPGPVPRHGVVRRGTKTIEQIAADLRARHPEPIADVPRSVDIVRELRDAR